VLVLHVSAHLLSFENFWAYYLRQYCLIILIQSIILTKTTAKVKRKFDYPRDLLRVSLNAEETVTVFPALFFYPKAGGRRLKH
jgi:hypothetical protein